MIPLSWLPPFLRLGHLRLGATGRDLWRAVRTMPRLPSQARHDPDTLRSLLERDRALRAQHLEETIARGRQHAGAFAARVVALHRAGRDARTVVCRRADGTPLGFQAGQFITVRAQTPDGVVARNYSLSSGPDAADTFAFTVREVAGGALSPFLVRDLAVGDTLEVAGPSGRFGLAAEDAGAFRDWVLLGAGAGTTPLRSVLGALLARPDVRRVEWVAQDRGPDDHLFRAEVDALAAADPRLGARWLHSRGAGGARFSSPDDVRAVVRVPPGACVLVCGPSGWMETVCRALAEAGTPPERVRTESFVRADEDADATGAAYPVRLARSQRLLTVRDDQTLLEAAQRSGVPLPFSCAMGGCGACAVRVIEGQTWMPGPNALTPDEAARGMVLGCIARPRSPLVLDA